MQGLGSPRGHQGSPIRPGPQGGHPEEVPAQGGYGRGPPQPPPYSEGPALPDRPPFKAYLGNIPYDLDEEVVSHFFRGLDVSGMLRQGGFYGATQTGCPHRLGRAGGSLCRCQQWRCPEGRSRRLDISMSDVHCQLALLQAAAKEWEGSAPVLHCCWGPVPPLLQPLCCMTAALPPPLFFTTC